MNWIYKLSSHVGENWKTITPTLFFDAMKSKDIRPERIAQLWESMNLSLYGFIQWRDILDQLVSNIEVPWKNKYTLFYLLEQSGFDGITSSNSNRISLLYIGLKLESEDSSFLETAIPLFCSPRPEVLQNWESLWQESLQRLGATASEIIIIKTKIEAFIHSPKAANDPRF